MEITKDGEERKISDIFGDGFSEFLDNTNLFNSATVKKDDKSKNLKINEYVDGLENGLHSKTELNKSNNNKKIEKKKEDKFEFVLISKKKQRINDEDKIKKKKNETISIKNKTEINDYKSKKKNNKEVFEKIYDYNYNDDNNEDLFNMLEVPQASDGLLNTLMDFDFQINQKKAGYTSQLNDDEESKPLDMLISSEVNN
jgi:hypothetical protein